MSMVCFDDITESQFPPVICFTGSCALGYWECSGTKVYINGPIVQVRCGKEQSCCFCTSVYNLSEGLKARGVFLELNIGRKPPLSRDISYGFFQSAIPKSRPIQYR